MRNAGRHRLMRLRPATAADAEAATALIIAVDIAQIGEADYSLERAATTSGARSASSSPRTRWSSRTTRARSIGYAHFRGSDLLAVVDPRREGEGAGTALLEWAERRARERGATQLRQAVGDRGASARALLEAAGWKHVRSYWRMERDVEPPPTRSRPACAPSRRADAPPCTRSTRPRSRASAATRRRPRTPGRSASSAPTTSTPHSAASPSATARRSASRSPAAGRTTRLRRRCSPSTPTTRAAASAARC